MIVFGTTRNKLRKKWIYLYSDKLRNPIPHLLLFRCLFKECCKDFIHKRARVYSKLWLETH